MNRAGRAVLVASLAVVAAAALGVSLHVAYQNGYEEGHVTGQLKEAEDTMGVVRDLLRDCRVRQQ